MHHRTSACFLILLLLCCGLKCNTDVARIVLPELTDTPETTDNVTETSLLAEIEAILAVDGEVHSPIPDDVYDLLWGHYTKAGSAAPRDYYTKYIDAGGIAIVGGNLVDDSLFQAARHIVLIMTSKLPGLRQALSIDTPGPNNLHFRLAIFNGIEHTAAVLPDVPGGQLLGQGFYGWPIAAAGMRSIGPGGRFVVHEMAHAIHDAFINYPQLFPDFTERLGNEYERQQEHFHCGGDKNNVAYTGPGEYWAHFVHNWWFDDELFAVDIFTPYPNEERLEGRREACGDVVNLADEVFPRVSIIQMLMENYW